MRFKSSIRLLKGIAKSKLPELPYKVNFAITNRCNSRCITCGTWEEYRRNPDLRKRELTLEEISKIFKNLSPFIKWLSLTGGEPFLRDDHLEIIRSAINQIPGLALLSIPTNGLLRERILKTIDRLKSLEGPDISISFSLDGPPEVHDRLRGIKGAYDITWNTYLEAKNLVSRHKRFHIHIETTVSTLNISSLSSFFERLFSDGHNVIITVAHDAYLYKNQGNENISPDPYDSATKDLFFSLDKHFSWFSPSDLLHKTFIRRMPHYLANGRKQVLPCAALKCSLAINPYGDVLPCLMWGKVLGNVREYNFNVTKILKSHDTRDVRRQIRESLCPNCWTPCEAIQTIIQNAPMALIFNPHNRT
jgi:MoaA/NifB/PqqE/SkfB family radical SAM enzyme